MDLSKLSEPFKADEIEWRVGQAGMTAAGKPWVKLLAYVTNRAIMDRLDATVGPANWTNSFQEVELTSPKGTKIGGLRAGIGIWFGSERGWVWKFDAASPSDIEPIKGAHSDAMKRAAVQWGMARYLYEMDEVWADVSDKPAKGFHWAQVKDKNDQKHNVYWDVPHGALKALKAAAEGRRERVGEQPGPDPSTPPAASDKPLGHAIQVRVERIQREFLNGWTPAAILNKCDGAEWNQKRYESAIASQDAAKVQRVVELLDAAINELEAVGERWPSEE